MNAEEHGRRLLSIHYADLLMPLKDQAVLGDMLIDAGHAVLVDVLGELVWEEYSTFSGWVIARRPRRAEWHRDGERAVVRGPDRKSIITADGGELDVLKVFHAIMRQVPLPELRRQERLGSKLVGRKLGGWRFKMGRGAWGWPRVWYDISAPNTGNIPVICSESPYRPMAVVAPRALSVGYMEQTIGTAASVDEVVALLEARWGTP